MYKPVDPHIYNDGMLEARIHNADFGHIFISIPQGETIVSLGQLERLVETLQKWQAHPPVEFVESRGFLIERRVYLPDEAEFTDNYILRGQFYVTDESDALQKTQNEQALYDGHTVIFSRLNLVNMEVIHV